MNYELREFESGIIKIMIKDDITQYLFYHHGNTLGYTKVNDNTMQERIKHRFEFDIGEYEVLHQGHPNGIMITLIPRKLIEFEK